VVDLFKAHLPDKMAELEPFLKQTEE
jgi:hypothetical protein